MNSINLKRLFLEQVQPNLKLLSKMERYYSARELKRELEGDLIESRIRYAFTDNYQAYRQVEKLEARKVKATAAKEKAKSDLEKEKAKGSSPASLPFFQSLQHLDDEKEKQEGNQKVRALWMFELSFLSFHPTCPMYDNDECDWICLFACLYCLIFL